MKIITNARPLMSPPTGVGQYTYNISREFRRIRPEHEYRYYYGYFSDELKLSWNAAVTKNIRAAASYSPLIKKSLRMAISALAVFGGRHDLYFEPNFVPINLKARRTVTTVYDFSFLDHPEWHPRERIEYFEANFMKHIGRSDAVITISNYVNDAARGIIGHKVGEIVPVHLGYDRDLFRPGPAVLSDPELQKKVPQGYILFVGSIEPRKNLLRLLQAYAALPDAMRREFKLLLAGFTGWENAAIMELLGKLKDNVSYLGYVSNEDLAALYRGATLFVYPSLYEGFGLPPLEAMACGCPVITSDVTSLPEVCGGAVEYINPLEVESIRHALEIVLGSQTLREAMIQKGFQQAAKFSWTRCAEEHMEIFERVVGRS